MIGKFDNETIRELSADEVIAVSGAKPMEREASRHTTVDWGWIRWQINSGNGRWVAAIGGDIPGHVAFAGGPDGKVETFETTP
jgi:hypothetical protein